MKAEVRLRLARVAPTAGRAIAAGPHWLSESEAGRLSAITAPHRRRQFLAARWALRELLAAWLGGAAGDWPLRADPDAAPRLQRPHAEAAHLALSHSGDWLAVAASALPIGLDIEAPRPRRDLDGLLAAACTPDERARLAGADADNRARRFHALWALKEAWLKQPGQTLTIFEMARIAARPDDGAASNARLWSGDAFALALVAPHHAGLRWHGAEGLDGIAPQRWRVEAAAP